MLRIGPKDGKVHDDLPLRTGGDIDALGEPPQDDRRVALRHGRILRPAVYPSVLFALSACVAPAGDNRRGGPA